MKSGPYFERFSFRKVGIWLQWVFSWFHGNRSSLSRLNSLNIRIEIWRQFLSHFKPFQVIVRSSGNKSVSKSNHLDKNWTFHCNISSTESVLVFFIWNSVYKCWGKLASSVTRGFDIFSFLQIFSSVVCSLPQAAVHFCEPLNMRNVATIWSRDHVFKFITNSTISV